MDVEEQDEYAIISEMEKPTIFAVQTLADELKTCEIKKQSQETVGNMQTKKKRRSRWDVKPSEVVKLENSTKPTANGIDQAPSTENDANKRKCSESGEEKPYVNKEIAEKLNDMKIEESTKENDKCCVMFETETYQNNSNSGIALQCDLCIAEPLKKSSDASASTAPPEPGTPEKKHDAEANSTEARSVKPRVVMKWMCTVTKKDLPTASTNELWESETEASASGEKQSEESESSTTKTFSVTKSTDRHSKETGESLVQASVSRLQQHSETTLHTSGESSSGNQRAKTQSSPTKSSLAAKCSSSESEEPETIENHSCIQTGQVQCQKGSRRSQEDQCQIFPEPQQKQIQHKAATPQPEETDVEPVSCLQPQASEYEKTVPEQPSIQLQTDISSSEEQERLNEA
ncbi:unnamed protein product, partial [Gongylonema pulchrum]|uniref:Fibrous sheath-interacting protein 1 n=1 Tax=Gongylonema pulchrum TaxID=637853 RepID=A0A183DK11_9BILA